MVRNMLNPMTIDSSLDYGQSPMNGLGKHRNQNSQTEVRRGRLNVDTDLGKEQNDARSGSHSAVSASEKASIN